jgi:hypothetical protein
MLADFMEVDMARNKLGERIDDGDDWFSKLFLFDTVGPP